MSGLTLHILVLGGRGVGKTTLQRRFCTGAFRAAEGETFTPASWQLNIGSSIGPVTLRMEESVTAGPLASGKYHGVLLLYDKSDCLSFPSMPSLFESVRALDAEVPVVVCATKMDVHASRDEDMRYMDDEEQAERDGKEAPSPPPYVTWRQTHKGRFFSFHMVSAKSGFCFEEPFLSVLRAHTGAADAHFVADTDT